ncbi:spermidine/putrescine ABC transporter substrate-binding protein [Terribacillus saccharophilus]|uniref:Spermidine/putrescine ABC transporter substrate-binding protein n=1 Tax=Terribacillus saccharophilus TaxID=361277 RepID=A0A268HF89_9BACI|nr:ABC transporter substrate-binding protein [Terribacillus saccharophilus]PAD35281.1 spermidine/putrescine ABC transporter substrate-binding protein [Terribacillus saccharophilus]PAD96037.1 spermidine/putrescine ABC transporter substrate-binding protein [Terribacillus saccharophilus]PAD99627.1 spermidine/putrescine ABC transporter substrate-binding protein [Terribacillus saccharophilus]PAE08547.1 spermidine/putrescine ABC transporter substrate-binding protein [Terribacillus saccharophilus]
MKQLIRLAVVIIAVSAILLVTISRLNASQGYSGGNTLTVYNWGDYIDPAVIDEFEKQTGITVVYETFDSNEAMMTKIQQGGTSYDVAVPSEYTIEKMKEEDLLLPIDHSKVPNLKNIDSRFMDLAFDPGNEYSVPYFWGTVGIVYNTKQIDGIEFNSWEDLWNPALKNEIVLIDGAREIVGMGLNSLHYSLNDTDPERLQEAYDKLVSLKPNVRALLGDENKLLMASGEVSIGITWSGDASEIMAENEDLDYVVPEEGSNLWFDNMVIPKTAKNIDAAHEFINFMLDPKIAAQNTEYVSYSTPNKEALQYMPEEMVNDERFYPPPELTDRLEVYENLGKENLAKYNELFLKFKME